MRLVLGVNPAIISKNLTLGVGDLLDSQDLSLIHI